MPKFKTNSPPPAEPATPSAAAAPAGEALRNLTDEKDALIERKNRLEQNRQAHKDKINQTTRILDQELSDARRNLEFYKREAASYERKKKLCYVVILVGVIIVVVGIFISVEGWSYNFWQLLFGIFIVLAGLFVTGRIGLHFLFSITGGDSYGHINRLRKQIDAAEVGKNTGTNQHTIDMNNLDNQIDDIIMQITNLDRRIAGGK